MNTAEQSVPWWKSDKFYDRLYNGLIPALLVALLIYSLARTDQQFADQNARFEAQIADQNARFEAQIADQNARSEAQFAAQTARIDTLFLQLGDLKAARAADGERLNRIEDMLRILIDEREDRIREQAQLSQ